MILVVLIVTGCSSVVRVSEYPFRELAEAVESDSDAQVMTPFELQSQLMRFADSYHSAVTSAAGKLRNQGKRLDPMRLLNLKLRYSEDLYAVVTGPNPLANLLDMITVVTMTRMQLLDYWIPKTFGDSADTLMKILREQERNIWTLAAGVLTPAQQNEMKKALRAWRAENRQLQSLDDMRATGFATAIMKYSQAGSSSSGSVFDLLDLDPLSALDPATQEIARTRHFGERALFLAQRMPTLLRWQSELLAMAVARLPQVQAALNDANRLTDSTDRLSLAAQQLPADIARERQRVLDALQLQSGTLSTLASRVQQALSAGNDMAKSTDATLKTFDQIYARLQSAPKDPAAKPFRIEDYRDIADQVAVTASKVNETLSTLQTLAVSAGSIEERQNFSQLMTDAEQLGDRLIGRLIRAGAALIGLACAGLLGVLIIYRAASLRLTARKAHSG